MKLIYIAGPLGAEADWCANVREACRLAEVVSALGLAVHVPHLAVLWHGEYPADYETWIARDLRVVECSNLVLRLPGVSPGSDREVEHASRLTRRGYRLVDTEELPENWSSADVARAIRKHFKVPA